MSLSPSQLLDEDDTQNVPDTNIPSFFSSSKSENKDFVLPFDNSKVRVTTEDKERIATIVQEASKGSSYYLNERRKAKAREKYAEELKQKITFFSLNIASAGGTSTHKQLERHVNEIEADLEASRHFGHYVHVDMDMFYAAVEIKKNPSLASVPLGVGSWTMLSTTNYVARSYGVRSAMPGFIGRRLCPALVIVPPDFAAYRAEAAAVRAIAAEYDADFASVGLDELTMDLSAHLSRRADAKTAADVAAEFRARVLAATGLTSSAGIAPTATLAKIASNYNKPNGQHELKLPTREAVIAFMRTLPVRQIPGIGKATEYIMQSIGATTLGDIYDRRVELCYILTEKRFRFLLSSALGVSGMFDAGDTSGMARESEADRKSISQEQTLKINSRSELRKVALENLYAVHSKLIDGDLVCAQIVLKIKWVSFREQQYTRNLLEYSDDVEVLRRGVDELLSPVAHQYATIRLVGVRLAKIITRQEYKEARRHSRSGQQRSLTEYQMRGAQHNMIDRSSSIEVIETSSSEADDVQCVSPPRKTVRQSDPPSTENSEGVIVIDD